MSVHRNPIRVHDLFDMALLSEMVNEGFVRRQLHPTLPYAILNYTDRCTYERVWNPVTTQCRGLIYHVDTWQVLARPFPKFFNWGEPGAPEFTMDTRVEVTDKLDGSLGILYPLPDGGWAVATRGSFDSEQARHATEVWQQRYSHYIPPGGVTVLVEIVYPTNRIVCDYGTTDDLYLLGAVDIQTGASFGPWEDEAVGVWPAARTAELRHITTLGEALTQQPRPGAEGMVLRRWHSEDRIKIKQDDYIALHRIITGCTKRRLWEHLAVQDCKDLGALEFLVRRLFLGPARVNQVLAAGEDWLDAFLTGTPEEFRSWVVEQVAEMASVVAARRLGLQADFGTLCGMAGLEPGQSRDRDASKRFVVLVRAKTPENFHMMMALWRGHEIGTQLWRDIYPEHELPYRAAVDEEAG